MANLITRYEVKVIAHYFTDDLEASSRSEAEEIAIKEFYDNAHRASIEYTLVDDEWLMCDDCYEERVDDDHECDEENDVANYY